jgi:hypothetical protein
MTGLGRVGHTGTKVPDALSGALFQESRWNNLHLLRTLKERVVPPDKVDLIKGENACPEVDLLRWMLRV